MPIIAQHAWLSKCAMTVMRQSVAIAARRPTASVAPGVYDTLALRAAVLSLAIVAEFAAAKIAKITLPVRLVTHLSVKGAAGVSILAV